MPIPLAVPLALGIGSKIASFFGGRGKAKAQKKAAESQRLAQIRRMELGQKGSADTRRSRLSLAQALLGGMPGTTAGGHVQTNVALDPEILRQLGIERKYDFSEAVGSEADPGAGAGASFVGGLLGDLGSAASTARAEQMQRDGELGGFGGTEFRPQDIPGMGTPFYDPNKDYEIK